MNEAQELAELEELEALETKQKLYDAKKAQTALSADNRPLAEKVMAGFASSASNTVRALGTILPKSTEQTLEKYGMPTSNNVKDLNQLADTLPGNSTRLLGDVATAIAPMSILTKAKGLGASVARIGAGAAAGAALSQDGQRDTGAVLGAGGGAIGEGLPLIAAGVGKVSNLVRNLVQPIFNKDIGAGRMARHVAGDKADDVVNELRNYKAPISGYNPTAGQAAVKAGSPQFSAMQEAAEHKIPELYDKVTGIGKRQDEALVGALREIGGTPAMLNSAIAEKAAASAAAYGKANAVPIKIDSAYRTIAKDPYFAKAYNDVADAAKTLKISPTKDKTAYLHLVKLKLDHQLKYNPITPIDGVTNKAVMKIKDQLVGWMDTANPLYKVARENNIKMSAPVNQMRTGQALEKSMVNPLSQEPRASSYATALRNAGEDVSFTTGKPRIADLTPAQAKSTQNIADIMANEKNMATQALGGRESFMERLGAEMPSIPATGFFSPKISMARALVNQLGHGATNTTLRRVSELMENPEAMAKAMDSAKPLDIAALNYLSKAGGEFSRNVLPQALRSTFQQQTENK